VRPGRRISAATATHSPSQTGQDREFLREHAGEHLPTCFGYEPAIRAMEQGRPFSLADLAPGTRAGLASLRTAVDAQVKDWDRYARQAADLHLKNARAWASAAAGTDLASQVDPGFVISPLASHAGFGRPAPHD
jgi:CO dehydrogenase maturation factor